MAKVVKFTINLDGNAVNGIAQLEEGMDKLVTSANKAGSMFDSLGNAAFKLNNIFGLVSNVIGRVSSSMQVCEQANQAQQEAETKLAQVMRNTMDAGADEMKAIKELTAAQQQLGVIGDEVQLAGAQELGTYLEKTDSLKHLIPVMNDMLAQQYGLNATQEQAVTIGSMMGKVMEGQVGALSRYGYKFDEAQEKILKYGTEEEKVATLAEVITQSVGGMNEALAATPEGRQKQVANEIGDIQERIGALWIQIQEVLLPIREKVMSVITTIIEKVEASMDTIKAVIPIVLDVVGVIGAVIAVVKLWSAAQAVLNAIMTANPIGVIIMAIAALIGIIVAVVRHTEGWGETWNNTMEYLKLTFQQCGAWLHKKWLEIEDFFMSGFETIMEGWYKVQSLWDGEGAAEGLNKLRDQRDERARAIAEAQGKIDELAEARRNIDIWQVKLKKDRKEESNGTSTMGSLLSSVNGGLNAASKGDASTAASKSAKATATGGTRNTTVNINLGKMVESIVFNGGYEENEQDMEQRLAAMLSRILGMAEATAG